MRDSRKADQASDGSSFSKQLPMLDNGKRNCNGVDLTNAEGALRVMKLPIPLKAEFAKKEGTCKTKEGEQPYSKGDAIMTGTKGEQWPIPRDVFDETYEKTDNGGMYAKKALPVPGLQMDVEFTVNVSWSNEPLVGKSGDWLVQYGPGDHGIVSREIFEETYTAVSHASETCLTRESDS